MENDAPKEVKQIMRYYILIPLVLKFEQNRRRRILRISKLPRSDHVNVRPICFYTTLYFPLYLSLNFKLDCFMEPCSTN